jgi:hypothetical protein
MLKDAKTGREWTVNAHKLKRFNKRPFLNTLDPLGRHEAPLLDSMRSEVSIPVADRARGTGLSAYTVSADGLASHGAEGISTTDVSDEIVPCPEDSKAQLHVPQGPSPSLRHLTGVTAQEQGRWDKRMQDKDDTIDLADLQEFELERIIKHEKRGRGERLYYEVEWKSDQPNTWQERDTFSQTEILQEYWNTRPRKEAPREFAIKHTKNIKPAPSLTKKVRFNMDHPLNKQS